MSKKPTHWQARTPGGDAADIDANCQAVFPVQPPTDWAFTDADQDELVLIRLNADEGEIIVHLTKDGKGIEVRGRHQLSIQPVGGNSVVIYLADERVDPGETWARPVLPRGGRSKP